MLRAHGGLIELGKKWADSILLRMGLVKRKATKSAKKVPPDFADIKQVFLQRVTENVRENKVPPELVIKRDQTGTKFVPTSQWTLAEQGAKQVDVTGLDHKREMTTLLACTLSGSLLPPQFIYAGKQPNVTLWLTSQQVGVFGIRTATGALRKPCFTMWKQLLFHMLKPLERHLVCSLIMRCGNFRCLRCTPL